MFAHQVTNQMVVVVVSRPTEMNLTDSEGIYSRNLQNFFARCARERVVGAASRPTGRPLEVRRLDRPAAGRCSIYYTVRGLVTSPFISSAGGYPDITFISRKSAKKTVPPQRSASMPRCDHAKGAHQPTIPKGRKPVSTTSGRRACRDAKEGRASRIHTHTHKALHVLSRCATVRREHAHTHGDSPR